MKNYNSLNIPTDSLISTQEKTYEIKDEFQHTFLGGDYNNLCDKGVFDSNDSQYLIKSFGSLFYI